MPEPAAERWEPLEPMGWLALFRFAGAWTATAKDGAKSMVLTASGLQQKLNPSTRPPRTGQLAVVLAWLLPPGS